MSPPLLSVKDLTVRRDEGTGSALFSNVSFDVNEGDIVVLKGRSGSGKTTLLKCLAELTLYQKGEIAFRGKKAEEYGVPLYRTKVLYVPQRPALLPGSPTVFLQTLQTFSSRSSHTSSASTNRSKSYLPSFLQSSPAVALPEDSPSSSSHDDSDVLDPYELSKEWDLPRGLWDRNWNDLSGGEAQRLSLAVALARGAGMGGGPEIVLLDEPTSALDSETSDKVEKTLLRLLPSTDHNKSGKGKKEEGKGGPKAYILITHSQEQADRLAGKGAKVVQLGNGGVDGGQDDGVRED